MALLVFSGCRTAAPERRACGLTEHTFQLPFGPGQAHRVIQGNHGPFSHQGPDTYAWDFAMPEGTPVLAAAAGVVVEVVEHHPAGGPDPTLADRANLVVIDHGDAHFSIYQHLRQDGVQVEEGDVVQPGQPIGQSGNSGYSTEPHLHFEVIDHRNRSQPICFVDVRGGIPRGSDDVRAPPDRPVPPGPTPVVSALPFGAFRENGVELTAPVPGRRLVQSAPLVIEGRVLRPAKRVVVFLIPRGGGHALHHVYGTVEADGRFRVEMDLSSIEGPYGLAVAAADPDGRFRTSYSVPVVVRPPRGDVPTASATPAARHPGGA